LASGSEAASHGQVILVRYFAIFAFLGARDRRGSNAQNSPCAGNELTFGAVDRWELILARNPKSWRFSL